MELPYSAASHYRKKKILTPSFSFSLLQWMDGRKDGRKGGREYSYSQQLTDFLRRSHSRGKPLQVNAYITGNAQKLLSNTHHDRTLMVLKNKSFFFNLLTEITRSVTADLLVSAKYS